MATALYSSGVLISEILDKMVKDSLATTDVGYGFPIQFPHNSAIRHDAITPKKPFNGLTKTKKFLLRGIQVKSEDSDIP